MRVVYINEPLKRGQCYHVGYAIEKIFMALDITPKAHDGVSPYDVCLNWRDSTRQDPSEVSFAVRETAEGETRARHLDINFRCLDISKSRIAKAHFEAFGYDLDIDPTKFSGDVVCKSDDNATHDGQIISCPIDIGRVSSQKVYSRLIRNTEGDEAIDFRVPFIFGFSDFFYEKRRPIGDRFSNLNSKVSLRNLSDEFSVDDLERMKAVCDALGADYGELDVLRDRHNGRLYVVDFAKTPFGPPNGLSKADHQASIEKMACAFAKNALLPLL